MQPADLPRSVRLDIKLSNLIRYDMRHYHGLMIDQPFCCLTLRWTSVMCSFFILYHGRLDKHRACRRRNKHAVGYKHDTALPWQHAKTASAVATVVFDIDMLLLVMAATRGWVFGVVLMIVTVVRESGREDEAVAYVPHVGTEHWRQQLCLPSWRMSCPWLPEASVPSLRWALHHIKQYSTVQYTGCSTVQHTTLGIRFYANSSTKTDGRVTFLCCMNRPLQKSCFGNSAPNSNLKASAGTRGQADLITSGRRAVPSYPPRRF